MARKPNVIIVALLEIAPQPIGTLTTHSPSAPDTCEKLSFEEQRKVHDYLLEGLKRVLKDRELRSIGDLPSAGAPDPTSAEDSNKPSIAA